MISGLLLPTLQPAIPSSPSHCSLYKNPFIAADNCLVSNSSSKDGWAVDEGFATRDVQSVARECSLNTGYDINDFYELESNPISPQGMRATGNSENYAEPAQSLETIQRSKSRKRALQLRNSADAVKSHKHAVNEVLYCTSGFTRCPNGISRCDHDNELETVKCGDIITEHCTVGEAVVGYSDNKEIGSSITGFPECESGVAHCDDAYVLETVTCAALSTEERILVREAGARNNIIKGVGSNTSGVTTYKNDVAYFDHDNELETAKSVNIIPKISAVEETGAVNSCNEEVKRNIYSGRITRARSACRESYDMLDASKISTASYIAKEDGQLPKSIGVSRQWSEQKNELLESIRLFSIPYGSCGVSLSKEKGSNVYQGRVTRSRSSHQPRDTVINFSKQELSCDISRVDGGLFANSVANSTKSPCFSIQNIGADEQQNAQGAQVSIVNFPQLHQPSSQNIGADNFQNAQGTQVSARRSSARQKDVYSCGESSRKQLRRGNTSQKFIAKSTRSPAASTTKHILKSIDSNRSTQIVTLPSFAASNNSQCEETSETSAKRSLQNINKDVELCTIRVMEPSKKGVVKGHATNASSGPTYGSEGKSQPANPSNTLGINRNGSIPSRKPQLAKTPSGSEKTRSVVLHELLSNQGTGQIVDLEGCAATVGEKEPVSEEPVEATSIHSGCNLDGDIVTAGLKVLVSTPPSYGAMLMKYNELYFDNLEQGNNENTSVSMESNMRERSSENSCLTLLDPADLGKETNINHQGKCNSTRGMIIPDKQIYVSAREEPQSGLSEDNVVKPAEESGPKQTVVSYVRETSVCEDTVTNTLPDRVSISKQKSLLDLVTNLHVRSQKEALLPNLFNGDTLNFCVDDNIEEHKIAMTRTLVSEDSKRSTDFHDTEICADGDSVQVNGLSNLAIQFPWATSIDESRANLVRKDMSSEIPLYKNQKFDFLRSCIDGMSLHPSKITDTPKYIQISRGFGSGMEKIDGQLMHTVSASPSLRVKKVHTDGEFRSGSLNRLEDNFMDIFKSQLFYLSHNDNASQRSAEEAYQNVEQQNVNGGETSCKKVEGTLSAETGTCSSANSLSKYLDMQTEASVTSSFISEAAGGCQSCSLEEARVVDPSGIPLDSSRQCSIEENQDLLHLGKGVEESYNSTEKTMPEMKSHLGVNGSVLCSVDFPLSQSLNLINADESIPVFERFIMKTDCTQQCISGDGMSPEKLDLPSDMIENCNVLEQLYKSVSLHNMLPHFSSTYELQATPNLHQPVPNQGSHQLTDNSTSNRLEAGFIHFNEVANHGFHGRSHSDSSPFPGANWDSRKPCTSSVGMFWDRITSDSSNSGKKRINLDLPCIIEENENMDKEITEIFQETIISQVMIKSSKREQFVEITEDLNSNASVSEAKIFSNRCSIDSVCTENSFTGTCKKVEWEPGKGNSSKRRYTSSAKEKRTISYGANGVKRATGSLKNIFSSRPRLSGKASLRKDGPSLSGMQFKHNNIVSTIASFIPLVQQKQAAPDIKGKRDIKVKALEAAEAAKRLSEKKENERVMKKEAMKLKRERLEQENLKQLELQKRKKEEERKKKEAAVAEKKRQREEEDRKEKERKRQKLEEGRMQRRDHKFKDIKCQATDDKAHKMKGSNNEKPKQKDEEYGILRDCGGNAKLISNSSGTAENSVTNKNEEKAYEISPYQCSDDEDDNIANIKFIPSWASKKSLAFAVSAQQTIDSRVIFLPQSFCGIDEVVLPRKCKA